MITPTKTYSSNPFVDNVIYYGKLMAMNCTIKDEEEALANETKESLYAGDVYISCIEGRATYEIFEKIPKEILEKYIPLSNNLDLYVNNADYLKAKLESYSLPEKNRIIKRLSALARTIYIDHFDTMSNYIADNAGIDWVVENEALYNKCKSGEATYIDLFDALPLRTNLRIIKAYLNSHGYLDLAVLWDPDSDITKADLAALEASISVNQDDVKNLLLDNQYVSSSPDYDADSSKQANQFRAYINTRSDAAIADELDRISKAMREVFISHYEIMLERKYFSQKIEELGSDDVSIENNIPTWMSFFFDRNTYEKCKAGSATWENLYNLFSNDALNESLITVFGEDTVNTYDLTRDSDVLEIYFNEYCDNKSEKIAQLNQYMTNVYLNNYQLYLNKSVYFDCKNSTIDIFQMYEYLPIETLKSIISTEIPEVTNLQTYEDSKVLLNSYLNTLPANEANQIKANITRDMMKWYPENHVETNNYYRSLIGLPPIDNSGNVYEDTLIHTWDANTKSFIEFGEQFINKALTTIYPKQHWLGEIYKFDSYDISTLTDGDNNIIEDYISACGSILSDPRYRYLKYLGDNKLSLYDCRKAMNFDLIGLPAVDDSDIRNKFIDAYTLNQDYIIRTVYSDAYKFQSDYYNKFIIIFILVNTIMDLVTGIPDYIINRDVFDARCIKYLFESFGIPYFSEIPVKYQQAMLKNLNLLIKYKSSTKNMVDICNLFGFSDAKVFGYYLMKDREVDTNSGEFVFDDNNQIHYDLDKIYVLDPAGDIEDISGKRFSKLLEYIYYDEDYYLKEIIIEDDSGNTTSKKIINNDREDLYIFDTALGEMVQLKATEYFTKIKANAAPASLKFIKVPINEFITNYKNNDDYKLSYDEVTQEITWDGGLDHNYLKQKILDYEFNIVKSKYISIETVMDATEMSFQMSYFYTMLFDNLYSEDLLTVEVPTLKINHKFKLTDLICFLFAVSYFYSGLEDNIMYSPTQVLYVKGYNFNESVNNVLNDSSSETDFYQSDDEYYVRGFNLEVDIDALDKWLNEQFQMSLDDFVISSDESSNDIFTLRQFYSLNNSYYQKSIFNGEMTPLQYNNLIKYAYEFYLLDKIYLNDIMQNPHTYIEESDNYSLVINPTDDAIYILNETAYVNDSNNERIAIYSKYNKSGLNYELADSMYYTLNMSTGDYEPLVSGKFYIKDSNGYIFAADNIYVIINDNYVKIEETDARYVNIDSYNRYVINYGNYYINQDGKYILNPENCYVRALINGRLEYILLKDIESMINELADSSCYIKHSDGKFIRFDYTDYYIRTHNDYERSNEMVYHEEPLYVISDEPTEFYDEEVVPRVYYRKLSDYFIDNENGIFSDILYVKDVDGNFLSEAELISPSNCVFSIKEGEYRLVADNLYSYSSYNSPINSSSILVLQDNYDYYKYILSSNVYQLIDTNAKRYVFNSDSSYITVFDTSKQYDDTSKLIVVLNKRTNNNNALLASTNYNASINDGIWDENDWYYDSPSDNVIGMSGENKWYYKNGDVSYESSPDGATNQEEIVGSGWLLESTQYIGNVSIESDQQYYLAFDLECNFNGDIQIYNTADASVSTSSDRLYSVRINEKIHVNQVFTANNNFTPEIRFIKYNFESNPINIGDYIIVSNIRFSKANNDSYIPTDLPSISELQNIYKTNKAIYKYLTTQMKNTSNKRMYDIYKALYDSLMITRYNKEVFKLYDGTYAKTYTDFLQSRDGILYDRLKHIKELDSENMKKEITDTVIAITYAIDKSLMNDNELQHIYANMPGVSGSFIQQYISKVINWFKSWKVQLLGINTVYRFGNSTNIDADGNVISNLSGDSFDIKILYDEKYDINLYARLKDAFVNGTIKLDIDTVTPDKVGIRDRIRVIVRDSNSIRFTDNYENMHIKLTDDTSTVTIKDGNILTIQTINGDEFKSVNKNQLLMRTDEDPEDMFAAQIIDEINLMSGDYIDYDELEDDDDE